MADADQSATLSTIKQQKKNDFPPRLRHRSRCSESENGTADTCGTSASGVSATSSPGQPDVSQSRRNDMGSESSARITSGSPSNVTDSGNASKNSKSEATVKPLPYRSVLSFLSFELTRGYHLAGDEFHYKERRERVYTFMSTPIELEKFCMFGFLQCVDTFLFFAAFLPIRIVIAVIHAVSYPCVWVFSSLHGSHTKGKSRRILQPAQVCDLLKGLLLGLACFCIDFIDTSRMYHMVRGQAVIKLYVFYNMLDLADRIVSGTGQDMLDSLYWTATEPGRKKRRVFYVIFHFSLALIYVLAHTALILGQATVLNVAFNSHNKALLTIMISNNFVEIKGSLFKRTDKNNLLQISCSDVKERFHYALLLFIVFIRNMTEFNWDPEQVWAILQDTLYVGAAEVMVDWLKHAFLTKLNEISSETYRSFKISLAQDILTSQAKYPHTDYSDQVCRRLGLAPIPLVCLLIQVCSKSIHISGAFTYLLMALFFLGMLSTKVLTSILLLSWGCRLLEDAEEEGCQASPCNIDSQVLAKKENTKETVSRERNLSEKSSPQRHTPDRSHSQDGGLPHQQHSLNGGHLLRVESVGAEPSLTSEQTSRSLDCLSTGDGDCHDVGCNLQTASSSVVESQSQVLYADREQQMVELFSNDRWEVSSVDSDSEFHSSHDENSLGQTKTFTGTPVVDYDDEKKYK